MIKPIVKLFIKRKLADKRSPSRVYGDHLQSIAIVACAHPGEARHTALRLRQDLRDRGLRQVDLYLCYPSKKALQAADAGEVIAFGRSSFNWVGRISSPSLAQAVRQDYEVLIDLTEGRSFPADVLITKLKARWKVGRKMASREYLLDLMIDVKDKDLQTLIHHMDHYLQMLNKPTAA